ncbi:hypothetical protein [Salinithrix halophila]|uniref:Uncharacterized protein n=1 Tax=Salinithrix halophila TaxID=1485204 RepID=A0ABV8JCE0_9BACL
MNAGKKTLYREVAQTVNQALGRKAITPERIARTVEEAHGLRQRRGVFALLQYVNQLPNRYFTEEELEILKAHPRRRELTNRMLAHLVREGIITYTESMMLKRMVP